MKAKIKAREIRRALPDLMAIEEMNISSIAESEPLEDVRITEGNFSTQTIHHLDIQRSVVESVSFAEANLQSVQLRDTRFIRCDFSNAMIRSLDATRVEFIDCRLIGMKAIECRMKDILLERCDARYAQFNDGAVRSSEFIDVQLQESDFRGVDLENSRWVRSNLSKADFRDVKLKGADLRGTEIEGIILFAADVASVIVSPNQAMELSRLLGLVIR